MIKRNALTFEERLDIYEFLKTVCKKEGDYAEYIPGWTDVAKQLGVKITNVQSIRMSKFGKTKDFKLIDDSKDELPKTKMTKAKLFERVEDLARRLEYLERELGVTSK